MFKNFKIGEILKAPADWSSLRDKCKAMGGNPDQMQVRSLDDTGYPIFTWEADGERRGWISTTGFTVVAKPQPASSAPFKVGDRVKCTNPAGCASSYLVRGAEYTVESVNEEFEGVCLKGVVTPYTAWTYGRFELVPASSEVPKEPDEVKPYFLVYSGVYKFDTQHATLQAAKDWVLEAAEEGQKYTIQEVREVAVVEVVRTLKEAA